MTVADKLREEGRIEGSYEAKVKVARNMLMKSMDVEVVMEITELSKEEIEKIKRTINN